MDFFRAEFGVPRVFLGGSNRFILIKGDQEVEIVSNCGNQREKCYAYHEIHF